MNDDPASAAAQDTRLEALRGWLSHALPALGIESERTLHPLTADASQRRFYRMQTADGTLIAVDAPPATENNQQYLVIAAWLRRQGLRAPAVLAADPAQGHFLVEDLGDRTLARALEDADAATTEALYSRVIDRLVRFQAAGRDHPLPGPDYDAERLHRETDLFRSWFVEGLLGLSMPEPLFRALDDLLTESALAQARTPVHLDWHCRNLMVCADDEIGIVDFQDARIGPVSYDLVSLLRDCYLRWPEARITGWTDDYLARASAAGIPGTRDRASFLRGFDLCGVQRHLKVLGIFARLHLRDGRDHYLADLPRVLDHLATVLPRHPEIAAFRDWFDRILLPAHAAWSQR
ncbi:MAG: phosphotransferase [Pseudomonadales bacterium]|nr:phosphotransferase [Pseudomonadales bacterium]